MSWGPVGASDLITRAANEDVRGHGVLWSPQSWVELGASYGWMRSALADLEAETREDRQLKIRRGFLMELARTTGPDFSLDDARRLLVATLVWGWGRSGIGPSRAASVIEAAASRPGGQDLRAVAAAATESAESAYRDRLFDSTGRTRLRGLGVAFGTKLLYFASFAAQPKPRPLIYDARVASALRGVREYRIWLRDAGIDHLPRDPSRLGTREYVQYLRFAHEVNPKAPDAVELALFEQACQPG